MGMRDRPSFRTSLPVSRTPVVNVALRTPFFRTGASGSGSGTGTDFTTLTGFFTVEAAALGFDSGAGFFLTTFFATFAADFDAEEAREAGLLDRAAFLTVFFLAIATIFLFQLIRTRAADPSAFDWFLPWPRFLLVATRRLIFL